MKDLIVNTIGYIICNFRLFHNLKRRLLRSNADGNRSGVIDEKLFRATLRWWQDNVYLKEKNPDVRERLKWYLMGDDAGKKWAQHYDKQPLDLESQVGSMTYEKACPLLPQLDNALKPLTDAYVIQIGASSGREIAWLAERHPKLKFLGTDIYSEIVRFGATRHHLPNLNFFQATANQIPSLAKIIDTKRLLVISSSSLQYVQPEHLQILFEGLSKWPGASIHLLEPSTKTDNNLTDVEGSTFMGGFAYAHNYAWYAKQSGMQVEQVEIISPYTPAEKFPELNSVVHYYMRAISAPNTVQLI